MDYFSKFQFIHKLYSLSTGTVINELKGLFSENGIPEVIISDGGPQFRFEFRIAQEWGFQHIQSHHTTISLMEKQRDLSELSKTPSPKDIRVAKTETLHCCATD